MSWLVFAFLTAFFAGSRDICVKYFGKTVPSYLVAVSQYVIACPILCLWAFSQEIPNVQEGFWLALVVGGLSAALGTLCFFKALELSDLSLMVPLRAITPALVLIFAPFIVADQISFIGGVGVGVLVVGLWLLNSKTDTDLGALVAAPGTKYMLLMSVIFTFSALAEKQGIISSSAVFFVASQSLIAFSVLIVVLSYNKKLKLQELLSTSVKLAPVGVCFALMMIVQGFALEEGPVSYIVAIKRTGIVPAVLFGCLVLRESNLKERLYGSLIVVVGAILVAFG